MDKLLKNKKIILIIGGGISAYKSLDLIRLLIKQECQIKVVLTESGKKFVTPLSIASLSKNKVYQNIFDDEKEGEMDHISLSRWCDIILYAPITANSIAKLAYGRGDDLASTLILASNKQIILVPAMNVRMWLHKSTQNNFQKLMDYGYLSIGPSIGDMACGEYGEGKMSAPNEIFEFIENYFSERNIVKNKKLKALVTAGPTKEYIDPVRFISNNSSGKQGYEIAKSLAKYGVETTLISGPSILNKPENVNIIKVETADEMFRETKKALPVDIAVCTAAVSDFKPEKYENNKIKKNILNLNLVRNIDILEFLSKNNLQRPKLVVGFAAETKNILKFAREKRNKKYCDWIVANDVSSHGIGFNSEYNAVSIIAGNKIEKIGKNLKSYIAKKIAKKIVNNFIQ
ncbi:MAG: bifunctional phosphopantothenoylcysteine decarboxylase/phosphopantothenate--cysteine ligase CoaBC [Candidatus Pelagibacterales bacterium]|nr:MAG: bifunctional phosphopantothenoylcysteine decarboxylase/phosphopantothenate--cysteine ligase CoaBC [Pelagibacterales bacterium]